MSTHKSPSRLFIAPLLLALVAAGGMAIGSRYKIVCLRGFTKRTVV